LRSYCLLKHVIERKIEGRPEVTGRQGRRCKQLLEDLKDRKRYWKLKEAARDSTEWRTALEDIMDLSWEDRLENGESQTVTLKSLLSARTELFNVSQCSPNFRAYDLVNENFNCGEETGYLGRTFVVFLNHLPG
jgi:hypothetical protein